MDSYDLIAEDGTALVVHVVPQTVPTTANEFHPSATHLDALGMPVAFGERVWDDGTTDRWTYLPTPTTPGLLRYGSRGWPAGTLVRWENGDGPDDYLGVRVVLPDGETVVCHEDDLVVPRVS